MDTDDRNYWLLGVEEGDDLVPVRDEWGVFLFDSENDALRYRASQGHAAAAVQLSRMELIERSSEEEMFVLNPQRLDGGVVFEIGEI